MKFQPEQFDGVNVVTRQERDSVWINGQSHESSVLVPWRGDVQVWPVASLAALSALSFEAILALSPELVIFGSGERLRFVTPALLRSLIDRRIGVETMDTAAACRTFNVLAGEGRCVVAALLIEAHAGASAMNAASG